ncbi:MAG: DUF2723 domain-containing protein, partial [Planctomycetes bacterium]|nr:DUF2723 domain-containing protein [Planctomycetota bacterium]
MGLSYARVLQQAPRAALPALVTFTAALAVYFRTLYPTVGPGDSGELALAAATLGVPHPPGYPLYVLVGRAFESLPFGDPAARANVMSACFGALAAATLCLGVRRAGLCFPPGVQGPAGRLTVWRTVGEEIPGVAAGLLFAYSLAAWRVSIRAEVFAPFAFVCALLLLGAVSWFLPGGQEPGGERAAGERGAAGETPRPVARRWGRWWLLAGVGIVCHQSMLFFAAPLGVAIGSVLPRDFSLVRRVAWAAAGLAAGLLPYLLLIPLSLRDPGLDWGDPETVERLLAVVTRREFGATTLTADAASSYDAAALSRQAEALGVGLTRHLSWAGLGGAMLCGIFLCRRSGRL